LWRGRLRNFRAIAHPLRHGNFFFGVAEQDLIVPLTFCDPDADATSDAGFFPIADGNESLPLALRVPCRGEGAVWIPVRSATPNARWVMESASSKTALASPLDSKVNTTKK
jgi:hypothetical protein